MNCYWIKLTSINTTWFLIIKPHSLYYNWNEIREWSGGKEKWIWVVYGGWVSANFSKTESRLVSNCPERASVGVGT